MHFTVSDKNKKRNARRATAAAVAQSRLREGEDNRGQSLVKGAIILTVGTILVKIIGAIFKIPLGNIIGEDGMGYFQSAYSLYVPIYTLAASGFASALSRQIAENIALRHYKNVRKVHQVAKRMFLVTGIAGTIVMVLASFIYIKFVNPKSLFAILMMCPSVLFCCIQASYRGYYEGTRNMYPTTISQIIEALGKLFLGLGMAIAVVKVGEGQMEATKTLIASATDVSGSDAGAYGYTVFGEYVTTFKDGQLVIFKYAAAAAVLGITIGSLIACIYLIVRSKVKADVITDKEIRLSPKAQNSSEILKTFMKIGLPIALGTLVLNIAQLIDAMTVSARLESLDLNALNIYYRDLCGMVTSSDGTQTYLFDYSAQLKEIPNALWGSYNYGLNIYNLVPYITQALGISALPAIAGAWATKDEANYRQGIGSVVRIVLLLGIPAGFGLMAMAGPILSILYPGKAAAIIAEPILMELGFMVLFGTLVTPLNSMLQAVGRQDVPVKLMLIGCALKITLNFTLVGIQQINIKGAPIGSICCYAFIVVASMVILCRRTKMKFNVVSTFIKPLLSGIICAVAARLVYMLASKFAGNMISTVVGIVAAVIVYALCIILLKVLTKDDVLMLPKGEKIAKILEKRNWIG